MMPFKGIRVLDMSRLLAGPFCTQMLGDLGAEIIKIESPEGDDSRRLGPPFVEGDGVFFLCANGGKKSVIVDLATAEGKKQIHEIAKSADILVENFRPGVADRLDIGFEEIRRVNPMIIYCSITGFGEADGDRGGVDTIFQSEGGLVSLIGDSDTNPMKVASPVADIAAAQMAAFAIASALLERQRSKTAIHISLSIRDALVSLLSPAAAYAIATGTAPPAWGNASQFAAPADIFETSDGRIAISIINNRHWIKLCEVLGSDVLASAERYREPAGRLAARSQLTDEMHAILRRQKTSYWESALSSAGIPFGTIRNMVQIVEQARASDSGLVIPMGSTEAINLPFSFNGKKLERRGRPPLLGEHTASFAPAE